MSSEVVSLRVLARAALRMCDEKDEEIERLRTVIRTGGAMYRAERAVMGIPGGIDVASDAHVDAVDGIRKEERESIAAWFEHQGKKLLDHRDCDESDSKTGHTYLNAALFIRQGARMI